MDLSATFDTRDQSILPEMLKADLRSSGRCCRVVCIRDRSQSVIVDGMVSAPTPIVYGVSQGSVLGPILFTLYSQPLPDASSDHECDFHKYAGDRELSQSAPPAEFLSVQSGIQTCTDDILSWMNSNKPIKHS